MRSTEPSEMNRRTESNRHPTGSRQPGSQQSKRNLLDTENILDQLSLLPPQTHAAAVWDLLEAVPEQKLLELVGQGRDRRLLLTGKGLADELAAVEDLKQRIDALLEQRPALPDFESSE